MPNNDLISRKALLKRFEELKENPNNKLIDNVFLDGAQSVIDAAPAVDAEPVRYGKLNIHTVWHTLGWGEIFTKFECCGFEERGTKKYNFCPNCGAKMDEKEG